jgi:hypothetical protein
VQHDAWWPIGYGMLSKRRALYGSTGYSFSKIPIYPAGEGAHVRRTSLTHQRPAHTIPPRAIVPTYCRAVCALVARVFPAAVAGRPEAFSCGHILLPITPGRRSSARNAVPRSEFRSDIRGTSLSSGPRAARDAPGISAHSPAAPPGNKPRRR